MPGKKVKIKIDTEKCKGCMYCIGVCPQKVLEASKTVNKRGMQYVVIKDPKKCTGCALCALVCPDCVIEIVDSG